MKTKRINSGERPIDWVRDRALNNLGIEPNLVGIHAGVASSLKVIDPPAGRKASMPIEIEAVANTAAVDLDDEVVVPAGGDPSVHVKYGAIYYNHLYGTWCDGGDPILPIGTLRYVKLTDQGAAWRIRFAVGSHPFAQDVATAMREGLIRGVSIGFAREDYGPPTDEELSEYGQHEVITRRWRWLETSVTPMPCNPEAMISGEMSDGTERRSLETLVRRGKIAEKSASVIAGFGLIKKTDTRLTTRRKRIIIVA